MKNHAVGIDSVNAETLSYRHRTVSDSVPNEPSHRAGFFCTRFSSPATTDSPESVGIFYSSARVILSNDEPT